MIKALKNLSATPLDFYTADAITDMEKELSKVEVERREQLEPSQWKQWQKDSAERSVRRSWKEQWRESRLARKAAGKRRLLAKLRAVGAV